MVTIGGQTFTEPADPTFVTDLPPERLDDDGEDLGCAHKPVPRGEVPWVRCRRCGGWGRAWLVGGDVIGVVWSDEAEAL